MSLAMPFRTNETEVNESTSLFVLTSSFCVRPFVSYLQINWEKSLGFIKPATFRAEYEKSRSLWHTRWAGRLGTKLCEMRKFRLCNLNGPERPKMLALPVGNITFGPHLFERTSYHISDSVSDRCAREEDRKLLPQNRKCKLSLLVERHSTPKSSSQTANQILCEEQHCTGSRSDIDERLQIFRAS
jgi:hypothetical protein